MSKRAKNSRSRADAPKRAKVRDVFVPRPFAGLTESFRGYDGIRTIAAAIAKAGKADPEAIRAALWQIELTGMNGKIKFEKAGPAGQESGQSNPGIYLIKIENGKVVVPSA